MKKEKNFSLIQVWVQVLKEFGMVFAIHQVWLGFYWSTWFFIINILIFHQAYMLDTAFCQVESKFTAFSNIFKHFYFDFQSPALSTSRSSLTGG